MPETLKTSSNEVDQALIETARQDRIKTGAWLVNHRLVSKLMGSKGLELKQEYFADQARQAVAAEAPLTPEQEQQRRDQLLADYAVAKAAMFPELNTPVLQVPTNEAVPHLSVATPSEQPAHEEIPLEKAA